MAKRVRLRLPRLTKRLNITILSVLLLVVVGVLVWYFTKPSGNGTAQTLNLSPNPNPSPNSSPRLTSIQQISERNCNNRYNLGMIYHINNKYYFKPDISFLKTNPSPKNNDIYSISLPKSSNSRMVILDNVRINDKDMYEVFIYTFIEDTIPEARGMHTVGCLIQ